MKIKKGTQTKLAKEFNLAISTIGRILNNKLWKN